MAQHRANKSSRSFIWWIGILILVIFWGGVCLSGWDFWIAIFKAVFNV